MSLKRALITVSAILMLCLATGAGIAAWAWHALNAPLQIEDSGYRLTVEPGSTLSRVSNQLAREQVLQYPRFFAWYGGFSGAATAIQVGEFDIPGGSTPIDLLEQLVRGSVVQYSFTIVEGWRFSEMLAALREHEAVTLTEVDADSIMSDLNMSEMHPEGQFLADTYHFPRGTSERDILRRAHAALADVLTAAWSERSDAAAVDSPYEALILASIIEKETGLANERRRISGVYSRRLKRGMRLQADPTVIYGLGEDWDGDIRTRDLRTDTEYNTYTRHGLPPTPIALFGRAAIEAALNPAEGDSLYFVATGEPDRSHYFSATLEEHNAAVQRYLERTRTR